MSAAVFYFPAIAGVFAVLALAAVLFGGEKW